MPNKNYIRGRRYEYEVQKQHLKNGASMSFRTAGSHGKFDVISIFPQLDMILLVQCKTKVTDNEALKGTTVISEKHNSPYTYSIVTRKFTKYIGARK